MPATVPRQLADELIGRGKHFVTTAEVARMLGVAPGSVRSSLRRSVEADAMLAITKDALVPVPPEHRRLGAPPPTHYIDALASRSQSSPLASRSERATRQRDAGGCGVRHRGHA